MNICLPFFQFPKMARLTRIAAPIQTISHLLSSSYAPIPAQQLSSFSIFSLKKKTRPLFIIISTLTHFHLHSFNSTLTLRSFPLFSITSPSTISHATTRELKSISSSTRYTVILGHRPFGGLASLDSSDSNRRPDWPPLRDRIRAVNSPLMREDPGDYWLVLPDTFGYEFESERALFDFYAKILALIVGSKEEAKRRIYFVSPKFPFGFGARFEEETARKLRKVFGGSIDVFMDQCALTRNKDPKAQLDAFTPMNWNHRLDDILSYHHLSEYNPEWSSGHWLVHIKQPDGEFVTKKHTVDLCVRMLADVVGSEEEALLKVTSVWCKEPFGFGAEIDEQTVTKLKALPNVLLVLPDYAFDVAKIDDEYKFALLVSPRHRLKSDSTYGYYQPSQAQSSKNLKGSMESLDSSVALPGRFTLMDQNRCLGNIFSYHHLSKQNPQWNFDHWLIVMKLPEGGFATEGQIHDFYVKILADVIGSEHEAKNKIYIIWCKYPCGFGAEIDMETSNKLQGCPHVLKVLPDYAFNVKDKDRGVLFISSLCNGLRFHPCNVYNLLELDWDDRNWDPNEDYDLLELGFDPYEEDPLALL